MVALALAATVLAVLALPVTGSSAIADAANAEFVAAPSVLDQP